MNVKKTIRIHRRAEKELKRCVREVQIKFRTLFVILEKEGKLEEPFGKKLAGRENLFEIRVKYQGQWRALYAYMDKELVIILSVFGKKTQKTPVVELEKAERRLQDYG